MSAVASYVRQRDGERCVGESRVTLRGIIASWQQGNAPERIQEAFPSLPLVAIYGAITYYLEHRDELDTSFRETETMLAARQAQVEAEHPDFFADLRARLVAHRSGQAQHDHASDGKPAL